MMMSQNETFLIRAADVRFGRAPDGRVQLITGEETKELGQVTAIFPISNPARMISLRDEEGREIGVLDDIHGLDPESRKLIKKELEKSYFMPRITDIYSIGEKLHVLSWEVETDRGRRAFEVRHVRQNVRRTGPRRFIVKDVDGNRYEIRDWSALPIRARRIIERHL
jgi:hypothetical protein